MNLKPVEPAQYLHPDQNSPLINSVQTNEWTHLASARFGQARQAGQHSKWTGDSYRYDIFSKVGYVALRWWNGSGEGWLITKNMNYRDESNLLIHIANYPNENQRWDACHFLWKTFSNATNYATQKETQRLYNVFASNKLKKRKIRGTNQFKITELP